MKFKILIMMTLALVFVVYLVPSVAAFEFDNKGFYDEETDTYTIRNSILIIPTTKVSEISRTGLTRIGATKVYLDFNYTLYEDNYVNPFKYIKLNKLINGNWIDGEQVPFEILVKQGTKLQDEDVYTENCIQDGKNVSNQICSSIKTSTKSIIVDNYISLDQTKLRSGDYQIRLILEKGIFDETDWILNLNGRELIEWDFLGNVLVGYWSFDDVDRTIAYNVDNNSINNLSEFTGGAGKTSQSKLGAFGMQFNSSTSGHINMSFDPDDLTEMSWSFWVNTSLTSGDDVVIQQTDGGFGEMRVKVDGGNIVFLVGDGASSKSVLAPITANTSNFIVVTVKDTDKMQIFVNNDNVANTSFPGTFSNTNSPFTVGGDAGLNGLNGFLDELGYWEVVLSTSDINSLYNGGAGLAYPNPQFPGSVLISSQLNIPTNNTQTTLSSLVFNSSVTTIQNLNLTNATIRIYNTTTNLFNISNISVTGDSIINESIFNIENFVRGTYFWNVQFCGIADNETASTVCSEAESNFTFNIQPLEISSSFNEFTYETASETFQTNVTLLGGDVINSVNLFYNGTSNSATSTLISGNNYTLQSTIDIPISAVGENTTQFFFSMNLNTGQDNLSLHNQSVGAINLSLFGQGIGGLPYINFTFQNETTAQESISSTFSSTWNYYLGSGDVIKTLNFVNASENFNYSFQFHPQNITLQADVTIDYKNSESQQRTFNPSLFTLTNITSLQTLLLLPTSDGLFQQFVTVKNNGDPIASVNYVINRTISGTPTEITSGTTDSSGFATAFLNPDFSYQARFSKTGFTANSFTFTPSNQLRTIIMGSGDITSIGNGTTIASNTTYKILPSNESLTNSTDFIFSFNVTSSQTITLISMNITNSSGFQVGFQSNAGTGFISQTINTGENNTFIGTFIIKTSTETIVVTKIWNIGTLFIGDYSIFRQGTLYTTYGFSDFIRLMLVIFTIISVLLFMSSGEVIDTSESKIAVSVLLIWIFSVLGWVTVPGTIASGANEQISTLSQFGNQYGIAILSSAVATFFIGRRVFR